MSSKKKKKTHWQRNFRLSWWWNDTEPALSETEAWVAGTHAFRLFRQWIGNILRVGRLLSVYADRHALYVKRHEKMFHLMFSFSFFPFFFLLYQKVIQLKTIDFFRSHIFFVRGIFCLIHPVPRSYFKQKWHGPHQRLAYCNRTGIY